ncbi:MAG: hypothetical protein Q7V05_11465 [Methanoregula sp.]|nr:hypothetical protein [Methanoregula sp.]
MAKKDNRFPRPILPFDIWGPVPANQDPRDNEYKEELDEQFRQSTIQRNRLESEKLQMEIDRLKRQEEIDKERWRNSPEGKKYIREMNQRYDDKRFYVRDKSLNFLIYRPIELIKNIFFKGAYCITYKHYISILYISILMVNFVIQLGIIGLFVGVLGCILPISAFYLLRFEIGMK